MERRKEGMSCGTKRERKAKRKLEQNAPKQTPPDVISRGARREKKEALPEERKETRRESVSEKGPCGPSRTKTRRQEEEEEEQSSQRKLRKEHEEEE